MASLWSAAGRLELTDDGVLYRTVRECLGAIDSSAASNAIGAADQEDFDLLLAGWRDANAFDERADRMHSWRLAVGACS